ncbi:MAG: 4'-phosphopantetheinyl transferase superfamily protein [Bacilli bacterium]
MEILYRNIKTLTMKKYRDLLNTIKDEKKNQIIKIKNINSKKRSLLGELLFKELLSNKSLSYDKIDIYINNFGKPIIKNRKVFFNISHSHDYSVCAISNNNIGIDIEKIRKVNINVIYQFATENEIIYITKNENEIYNKLFEIYTLKEAYFKCLGTNLNYIKEVEFLIKNNNVLCSDQNISAKIYYNIYGYIISTCEIKSNKNF